MRTWILSYNIDRALHKKFTYFIKNNHILTGNKLISHSLFFLFWFFYATYLCFIFSKYYVYHLCFPFSAYMFFTFMYDTAVCTFSLFYFLYKFDSNVDIFIIFCCCSCCCTINTFCLIFIFYYINIFVSMYTNISNKLYFIVNFFV